MAAKLYDDDIPVAYLLFCSTRPGSTQRKRQVYPSDQFDIGRNEVKQALGSEVLTISTHHLRFRCIVYEEDNEHEVAPMIYFRVLSFNSVELKRVGAGYNTGVAVSNGHGDVLLSAGDMLKLTPDIYLQFHYHSSIKLHNDLDDFQRAEAKCFKNQFFLSGRRLGVGGQASVYVAVKQSTKRQFACKAVPLPETGDCVYNRQDRNLRMTDAQREAKLLKQRRTLAREYTVLEKLNHPNIVSLEKVICATYDIYVFQELITGGDLLSYLDQTGALGEPQAAVIVLQLLKAVDYLHINGFAHRDIKPENILMTSWRDGARIVLTDFGQAREIDAANSARRSSKVLRMQTIVGTFGYTAPEIFHQMKNMQPKGYSKAVDIWSIGCVTATLLTGDTIFPQDETDFAHSQDPPSESTYRRRWNANIVDGHPLWVNISRKAKRFVKGCLAKDEEQRMTAKQALVDDWFTNKHYASDLAAAYERAIADWQPRKQSGSLVDFIDTRKAVSISSAPGHAKSAAAEIKSKHFQTVPEPPDIPLSAMKKTALAFPNCQRPPPPSPMSRDAKNASLVMPPSPHCALAEFTFASPIKPSDSVPFSNYTATAGTDPLSIHNYRPPQTQLTIPPPQLLRRNDSVTQSQPMLDEPTQTQPTAIAEQTNYVHSKDIVLDSQETQIPASAANTDGGRPRKKVCR